MKRMRYMVALLLAMLLSLTACSVKEPMAMADFVTAAEQSAYVVEELDDSAATTRQAVKGEVLMTFSVFESDDGAKSRYDAEQTIIELQKGSGNTVVEVNMAGQNSYGLTTGQDYHYISRVENTLLIVYAPKEEKSEVLELVKELGY